MNDTLPIDNAQLLELLHAAPIRWRTFQALVRDWQHVQRSREAFHRHFAGRGAAMRLWGPGRSRSSETQEELIRVWVAGPKRMRNEVVESDRRRGSVTVVDGDRWWLYEPGRGVMRHDGGDSHTVGTADVASILDPSVLIPHLAFDTISASEIGGRGVWVVNAAPRQTFALDNLPPQPMTGGADQVRLWVDRERGTALRLEWSWQGEPYWVREATEVVFDADLPDELFSFEPPPDTPVFTTADAPTDQAVSLEEAARLAPFTVLVPRHLPPASQLKARFTPGGGFHDAKPMLVLHAREETRHRGVNITETAEEDAFADRLEWRVVDRDGGPYLVHDEGGERLVKVDRHGTHVRISGPYEIDVLLDVAASLEPI